LRLIRFPENARYARSDIKVMSLFHLRPSLVALLLLLQSSFLNAAGQPDTTPMQCAGDYSRSLSSLVEGSPTELGAVIELTGTAPQSICDWLHQNIRFEDYTGIMKGAKGTLVSGAGNAADQALLMASLFEYVGIPASLVQGRITRENLPGTRNLPVENTDSLPSADAMQKLSRQTGIDQERLYMLAEGIQQNRQLFLEHLWTRTLNDLNTLGSAMDAAGIPIPDSCYSTSSDSLDHWWVRTPGGDFDCVTGNSDAAAAAAGSAELYALDAIPETAFHQVRFRMWIQRAEGSVDQESNTSARETAESVLDMSFHSADLFGETLAIGNVPLDIQSTLTRLKNPTPDQVLEALASAKQFQPQLITPLGLRSGHPFDKSGNKLQVKEGRIESVQKIGGSMGGLWGGISGGEDEQTESHLVAHWLEIELIAPESADRSLPPVIIRRDLLANPASETCSLEILTARELLVLPDELSSAWVSRKSLDSIASMSDYVNNTLTDAANLSKLNTVELIQRAEQRPQLPQTLFGFGLARKNELLRLQDRIAPQSRIVKQRPGIVSMVSGFYCPDGSSQVRNGLDILHQAFQVEGPKPKNWKQSLSFAAGVLDTALELTIMESLHAPADIRNASLALEQSLATGRQPGIATSDEGVYIQIKDATGDRIVAHYAVDPMTGMSLGMMNGGGQAMAEYAEYVAVANQLRGILGFYGDLFRCIGLGITYPLTGGTKDAKNALASCVFETACGQITGMVGTFVEVDTCWTNVILQTTVDELFNGVCASISKQLFN